MGDIRPTLLNNVHEYEERWEKRTERNGFYKETCGPFLVPWVLLGYLFSKHVPAFIVKQNNEHFMKKNLYKQNKVLGPGPVFGGYEENFCNLTN